MKNGLRRPIGFLAVALLTKVIGASVYASEGSFERNLKVTGPVELDVSTGSGHINLRAGDSASVRIRGTIKASSNWRLNEAEAERKVRYLESTPPSSSMETSSASDTLRTAN